MEGLGWFITLFGLACFGFGILTGYNWGRGNGYQAGLKTGEETCEARHLGSLGDK